MTISKNKIKEEICNYLSLLLQAVIQTADLHNDPEKNKTENEQNSDSEIYFASEPYDDRASENFIKVTSGIATLIEYDESSALAIVAELFKKIQSYPNYFEQINCCYYLLRLLDDADTFKHRQEFTIF